MKSVTAFFATAALAAAVSTSCTTTGGPAKEPTAGELAFKNTIKPLLEHRCVHCHNDDKPLAGLNFQDRDGTMDPAKKFIVPGNPQESRLYLAVTLESAHPRVMPGDGWGITSEQKAAFKTWIDDGAPWSERRGGGIRKKDYRVDLEDYL